MGSLSRTAPDRSIAPAGPVTLATPSVAEAPARATVAWIDGEHATLAHWAGYPIVEGIASDTPARHRSTGHIRHDPGVRHGGGAYPDDRMERDRRGHRDRFVERVAAAVPSDGLVLVLGPADVRDLLATAVRAADRRAGRTRPVTTEATGRLTDRQLVARLRSLAGAAPRRRVVGRR